MAVRILGFSSVEPEVDTKFRAGRTSNRPVDYGAFGMYQVAGEATTMAAALAANAELFQFRWLSGGGNVNALVYEVLISAAPILASTAAQSVTFCLTPARGWSVAGSGGTRLSVAGNNAKLATAMASSTANDIGISTTAGLTAGTKTLDTANMAEITVGIGTGAITTYAAIPIIAPSTPIFRADAFQHPLVLANQEGFVIRNGITAWPATMTWRFSVSVQWAEVAAW